MPIKMKKQRNENEKRKLMSSRCKGKKETNAFTLKSELLLSELTAAEYKRKNSEKIKVEEDLVSLNVELGAFIKECRNSNDGQYVVITMLIFEMTEPVEKSFVFNKKTSALNYLLQIANKFSEFRETQNFVDLMGKAAMIVVYENKGFYNFKVKKEMSIVELDEHIANIEEELYEENADYDDEIMEEDNGEYDA